MNEDFSLTISETFSTQPNLSEWFFMPNMKMTIFYFRLIYKIKIRQKKKNINKFLNCVICYIYLFKLIIKMPNYLKRK